MKKPPFEELWHANSTTGLARKRYSNRHRTSHWGILTSTLQADACSCNSCIQTTAYNIDKALRVGRACATREEFADAVMQYAQHFADLAVTRKANDPGSSRARNGIDKRTQHAIWHKLSNPT